MSLLFGYYAHLFTDQKMAVYIQDAKKVRKFYKSLRLYDKKYEQIIGVV